MSAEMLQLSVVCLYAFCSTLRPNSFWALNFSVLSCVVFLESGKRQGRPCRNACVVPALVQQCHRRESSVMPKLTKQFIESGIQPPVTGQRFYRDDDVPGFAIRVTRKSKSYILEKRVDGVNRRITIGKCSEMSFDSAKKQACSMLGDIAKGNDPKTGKRINTLNDITLREVLQKFLEIKPIRKGTRRNYHFAINRHFNDWLDQPITSITKDMVEQRHHELTVSRIM